MLTISRPEAAPTPTTASDGQVAPPPSRPFRAGAYEKVEPAQDTTTNLSAALSTTVGPLDIPSGGYLRNVVLLVSATAAANAATVVFTADGPWAILDNITLLDVNGATLVGPISGFDLFLVNKYGGYEFDDDPTRSPAYLATAGAVAAGGSFGFLLRIPVEAVPRDAIGSIPNGNAAATLKIRYTVNPTTTIYSTAPTTIPPNIRVIALGETWTQPASTSPKGFPQAQQPPAVGTLSQWSKQAAAMVNGQNTLRLTRMGNLIRNMIIVFRDSTGARSQAMLVDPFRHIWEGKELINVPFVVIRHYMQERFGYNLGGGDTGVYVLDYSHDFDGHPGGELRDLWLPTTTGTRMEFNFSTNAGGGSVSVLYNDIAVAGDQLVS